MKHDETQKDKQTADLRSLGITSKRINDMNDKEELEKLAENIKESMYQDYKLAYSEKGNKHRAESESTTSI